MRELGLEEGAWRDDLILAYRRSMILCHPDRVGADEKPEARRKAIFATAAFSALEKSLPQRATRSPSASAARASEVEASYGQPRLQNASFEATSIDFLPARAPTEMGLNLKPVALAKSEGISKPPAKSPIQSTALIGGAVILFLITAFAMVGEKRPTRPPLVKPLTPIAASREQTTTAQPAPSNTAPDIAIPSGRILAKTNRVNASVSIRKQGDLSIAAGTRVGERVLEFSRLPSGEYLLTAQLAGWPDISRTVTLGLDQQTEALFEFVGGTLRLDSDPTGAVVSIGGKLVGRTPLQLSDLPPGQQALAIKYQNWPEFRAIATIEADRETVQSVHIPYGQLNIQSRPAGAKVFIDGEELGLTPMVVSQVPSGLRQIRLVADNYEAYETSVSVTDRSSLQVQPSLVSNIMLLDPTSLLNAVWIEGQQAGRNYEVAPSFERTSAFRPRNGVVKNLDRSKLYAYWAGRQFRFVGTLKQFDPKTGTLEFSEDAAPKSKYRLIALLSERSRANRDFTNRLLKGARVEIVGRLTAVEEPRWPSKTIVIELGESDGVN